MSIGKDFSEYAEVARNSVMAIKGAALAIDRYTKELNVAIMKMEKALTQCLGETEVGKDT